MSTQVTAAGPWRHAAWLPVGGLVAIGFPSDTHLLAVSWNGRGIFDLRNFQRTARDDEDPVNAAWIAADRLSVAGIGEFSGRMVAIVGLWGGRGHLRTPDGWRLEPRVESGTVVSCSLTDPSGVNVTAVPLPSITEYRAVSFSPSGRFLLLASTSEVEVMTRPAGRTRLALERAASAAAAARRGPLLSGRAAPPGQRRRQAVPPVPAVHHGGVARIGPT